MSRPHVLFLCTHNSARSQMAEGLLRHKATDRFEAFSAGTHAESVNPLAVTVMSEVGIDISHQRSKPIEDFAGRRFDIVITVCDRAREECPYFPAPVQQIHWLIQDPTSTEGGHDARLEAFRKARNELDQRIALFLSDHPPYTD
ncbi:MAG: arsenate reductase ArsC [Candidatus Methylomirabilis sp.]